MHTTTIALSDEQLGTLYEMPKRHQVPPEELVCVSVGDVLADPDERFQQVLETLGAPNSTDGWRDMLSDASWSAGNPRSCDATVGRSAHGRSQSAR